MSNQNTPRNGIAAKNHLVFPKVIISLFLSLALTASAAQTARLLDPDFAGLFALSPQPRAPLLRDAARGWTYFQGGNVEGVAFGEGLFRVSDAGVPDLNWRVPPGLRANEVYLADDGAVVT